jgi:ABC-type transport system involved in multi-copper enzyme maturation permease subunit
MTFLPVVDRELRVACRRRFTFWSRLLAALFALIIFGLLLLLAQTARGMIPAGQMEFVILKWMAFIYAATCGIFLTADALSEEKREGTLGLLFLTDLRGYDVVLGKLFSQSLRAFYALLAAFPIIGLSLLSGGVTGGEFWRSILVICDTLFFSLALGMFVSAISRDSTKAMTGSLALVIIFFLGPPSIDSIVAGMHGTPFAPHLSPASPAWLFASVNAYRMPQYWSPLAIQFGLAWVLLIFAGFWTPRSWQEKSVARAGKRPGLSRRWRYGGPRARAALRLRWLKKNPVVWLALRDRWLPRMLIFLSLVVLAFQVPNLINEILADLGGSPSMAYRPFATIASSLQWLLDFGLTLWVAIQASRLFVDAGRNGALELLLVTPVTPRQIVYGQWAGLWRTFLVPAICMVSLKLAVGVLTLLQLKASLAASAASAAAFAAKNGSPTVNTPAYTDYFVPQSISLGMSVFSFLAGLAAVGWFGMWMGMRNRKTTTAVLKTVLFVFVLPWIAFLFATGFLMFAVMTARIQLRTGTSSIAWISALPTVFLGLMNLGKDFFFIFWARNKLLTRFRLAALHEERTAFTARPSAPPPLPPPAVPPPVVPPPFVSAT